MLLKDQKTKKFQLTEEAMQAFHEIKEVIKQQTMIYHMQFDKPLYIATDASQVGAGGFLYQIDDYPNTEEGKNLMLSEFGYIPEQDNAHFLIPGVSPGRKTPVVTDFLRKPVDLADIDSYGTITEDITMTEKLQKLQNKIIHVRPVLWYSKAFNISQIRRFTSMEKEFLALLSIVLAHRDYIEAVPLCFVLTDCMSIMWALKHKDTCMKLSRYIIKLFELNIHFIISHVTGEKNAVSDYLSRIYVIPDALKREVDGLKPKSAQHVNPSFTIGTVLTRETVLTAFAEDTVKPCANPNSCSLDANSFLYRGLGPFEPPITCIKKMLKNQNFGLSEIDKKLTFENICLEQHKDVHLKAILDSIEKGNASCQYIIDKNLLKATFPKLSKEPKIVVPSSLVPYVLAFYHLRTHAGHRKMLATIKQKFIWKNMNDSVLTFAKGCTLCSIHKHNPMGKIEIGIPRKVLTPLTHWQMDIVSGLIGVKGKSSFINFIELFSGYSVPVPLTSETSDKIADIIENHIFKPFGIPIEISADNAANLGGPAIVERLNFYNVTLRRTVPYSPESHSNVENSNRFLVEMLRLLCDQYECSWVEALPLAAVIVNGVPRPILCNHSPYFLLFSKEPFEFADLESHDGAFLNIENHITKSINDKVYKRLLIQILLDYRIKANERKHRPYRHFPVGSLILVKDFSVSPHKKLKPVFTKSPELVVSEYHSTVYSADLFGRVKKRSKNNIKLTNHRTLELFGQLPDDVKLVLGDVINTEVWNDIKNSNGLPAYLENIDITQQMDRLTRGRALPHDSHLIEHPLEEMDEDVDLNTEGEFLDETLKSDLVEQLNTLHSNELLNNPGLTYQQIPALYHDFKNGVGNNLAVLEEFDDFPTEPRTPSPRPQREIRGGIDEANILPEGTRRVRFA
jgi:hypothetical protein